MAYIIILFKALLTKLKKNSAHIERSVLIQSAPDRDNFIFCKGTDTVI